MTCERVGRAQLPFYDLKDLNDIQDVRSSTGAILEVTTACCIQHVWQLRVQQVLGCAEDRADHR